MEKDRRYDIVKKLINGDQIDSFLDILDVIPKTTLARDIGMHHITFQKLLDEPDRFILHDIFKIASLIGVDKFTVVRIICNETLKETAKKTIKSRPRKKK
jgi:hypothetical protein